MNCLTPLFIRVFPHLKVGLLTIALMNAQAAWAVQSVVAIALFDGKAMLSVDGGKGKIVAAGERLDGVLLVSSDTSRAVIEVDGQTRTLLLSGTVLMSGALGVTPVTATSRRIELSVNSEGFFEVGGSVDGESTQFLVDTGANLVVMSSAYANRLDLDYTGGVRTVATTASGTSPMILMRVDEITISEGSGSISLDDIQVGVIQGAYPPIPLLGMSFLSRVRMERDGDTMVLESR